MVDFDNESTIGTPAGDIVRVLILQARANLLEAWEQYMKYDFSRTEGNLPAVRSRIVSLFNELQGTLKRKMKKEEYEELYKKIYENDDIESVKELIEFFNIELDTLQLTRIDNRQKYDTSKVENENKVKKL